MKPLLAALLLSLTFEGRTAAASDADRPLRVAFITPAARESAPRDPAVIFYDDFAAPPEAGGSRYLEYNSADGSFVWSPEGGCGAGRCAANSPRAR